MSDETTTVGSLTASEAQALLERAEKAERERDAWMETARLEQTAQETFKAERDEARACCASEQVAHELIEQVLTREFGPLLDATSLDGVERLIRERDEAIKKLDEKQRQYCIAMDDLEGQRLDAVERAEKAEHERDEARDLVQALSGFFGPPTAAVFAQADVAVKRWESEP